MTTYHTNCNGCDCGPSTPEPCLIPPPICPDPQPCDEYVDAQCVIYNGEDIICNGQIILASGTSVTQALLDLLDYINSLNGVNCAPACKYLYDYLKEYALDGATASGPPNPNTDDGGDGGAVPARVEVFAVASDYGQTPAEVLDRLLDKGYVMPVGDSGICCPTCGPYVLASVETFLKYAEAVGLTGPEITEKCCTNAFASVETYLKYLEAVGTPNSCNNGFTQEVNTLLDALGTPEAVDRVQDKGIVESGSVNTDLSSSISDLQDLIEAMFSHPNNVNASFSSLAEILDRILDKGIVLYCDEENLVLASVETYLKFAEAYGLTQSAVPA